MWIDRAGVPPSRGDTARSSERLRIDPAREPPSRGDTARSSERLPVDPAEPRLSRASERRVASQVTLSAEESTNVRQRGPAPAPAPAPADPERAASVRRIAEQLSGLRGPLHAGAPRGRGHPRVRRRRRRGGGGRGAQPVAGRRARRRDLLLRLPPHVPSQRTGSPSAEARPARPVAPRTSMPRPPTGGPAPPTSRWVRSSASGSAPWGRPAPSTAPCTPRCRPSGSTP